MTDIDKIKTIYDRQADRAYRTALVILKDPHSAEDAVQSIFVTLIEKDLQFENEQHETAWIIRAVRNRCLDMLKSKWNRDVSLQEDEEEMCGTSDYIADDPIAERERLTEMLMKLPETQREVLYLKYYEGFTVSETAEIMGIKESSVRSAINSAKRNLVKGK